MMTSLSYAVIVLWKMSLSSIHNLQNESYEVLLNQVQ